MRHRITVLVVVAVAALAAASGAQVASAGPTATIDVTYSGDFLSATITSTKGISNFVVTLCSGSSFKVELNTEQRVVTIGPFGTQIVSVTAKAGTSVYTEASGAPCTPPPPPNHHGDGHAGDDVHDVDHREGDAHPFDHHH